MSGDTFVAGIGDEVITTFSLLSFMCLLLLFMFRNELSLHYRQFLAGIQRRIYGDQREPGEDDPAMRDAAAAGDAQPRHFNTGSCPICLNDHAFAVETNCGHLFCGSCIRTYYENGDFYNQAIRCPLCRQMVTMYFVCFTEAELVTNHLQARFERQGIMEMVRVYNERNSGNPRPLLSYLLDWPTLMRHLWNEFFTVGGLVYMFRIRIVMCFMAGLIYLFSPLDIVPEAVFGVLGLLDDIFVLCLLAIYISIIYRRVVVARNFTG